MKSTQELIDEASMMYEHDDTFCHGAEFAKPLYVREGFARAVEILKTYNEGTEAAPWIKHLKAEGIRLGILPKDDEEKT